MLVLHEGKIKEKRKKPPTFNSYYIDFTVNTKLLTNIFKEYQNGKIKWHGKDTWMLKVGMKYTACKKAVASYDL